MSDEDSRLKVLVDARTKVQSKVDRFGASPIFGFTRWKFFFGVSKTYLSAYVFGVAPAEFWKWHVFQFWALLPVHCYRWWHMNNLLYFCELCWVSNLGICTVLPACHLFPNWFSTSFTEKMMNAIFALSAGPLCTATILFGNALVPHSIDHTMSLLIHLSPLMTSYSLACNTKVKVAQLSFWEYMQPVMGWLGVYTVCHSSFFLTVGLRLCDHGQRSSPADQFALDSKKSTVFTKLFGRLGSGGSDTLRYLKYEAIMLGATSTITALSYGLYFLRSQNMHFGLVVATWASAIWNGASWYAHNLKGLTAGIDEMIKDIKEENNKKDM